MAVYFSKTKQFERLLPHSNVFYSQSRQNADTQKVLIGNLGQAIAFFRYICNYSSLIHMRYLFLVAAFLGACSWLAAQAVIEKSFEWAEEAKVFTWEGEQFYELALAGAVLEEKSNVLLPQWIEQFPLPSNGDLQVVVLSAEYENFTPDPRFELSAILPETLGFQTSVSRSPQGWQGKVSFVPMLRGNSGYQRLRSIRLRVIHQPKALGRSSFTDRSVLADGDIYQIAVTQTGIHKLSRDFLQDALGITNLDNIDPRSIRLYGQRGGMLPEVATDEVIDDLQEYPILLEGEADGRFDAEDALIFYAEGPTVWEYDTNNNRFSQSPNLYDNKNYYYIKVGAAGNGLRVASLTESGGTPVSSFDDLHRFEKEAANPLHVINTASGSGQIWLGDFFKNSRERTYNNLFTIPDLVAGEAVQVSARMALRSGPISANSYFFVEIDGQELRSNLGGGVNYNSVLQSRALNLTELNGSVNLSGSQVNVKVSYPFPANAFASEAWLDYVQIVARRQLRLAGDQLLFRDTRSRENANITWQLSNATASTRVWRLSPSAGPVQLSGSLAGNVLSVGCTTNGELQELVAFNPNGQLLEAEAIGRVDNQNLHGILQAEMLIVSHPNFLQHAETLAEHRRSFSGLDVAIATTDAIYHEFSSGKEDPAAIRNFAKMLHERDGRFRYLLLVGDGSFDHRNIYQLGSNFIPVFEHQGTFNEVADFPADDFYGIFTASPNRQPLDPDLNISVGRLPVRSSDQAREVVAKIVRYDTNPAALGNWRNRMVFVGDDEDGGQHTRDVDGIARSLEAVKPELNFDKLYFDLFPQISISSGDRYPDVTEGLNRAVVRGSLAITYLGHGGPRGWAQERVLSIPQIRNWRNPDHLPIFITATCTFASFDDAAFVSAGEETLLSSRGGAVALLTTTRPVFATQNRILTERTTAAMVERPDGQWRTLGDVILIAKNAITTRGSQNNLSGNTQNARKFTLLGDPASVVALPIHNVRTSTVNQQPIDSSRIDTIGALDQITIGGEIVDVNGNLLSSFNGLVYPTVFDKAKTITTLQQDAGSPAIDVSVQQNIIFRGRATVTNGRFSFTFVVPRDIDYQFGKGKISYYAADPSSRTDASGFYDQIVVGGTSRRENTDNQGPDIEIFMNNDNFVAGDEVEQEATLILKLRDDSGINITGNSIGHDLEAVIDDDTRNTIVLNDYYEANPDDFQAGEVRYPLFDLEPGLRKLSIRAWDVANNSSIAESQFLVVTDAAQTITHLLNYPNPFTDFTCFQFDHTLLNQDVEALVQIYTISGRLVKTIRRNLLFSDGSLRQDDCIEWNGTDDFEGQLARGVYLYQVRLKGEEKTIDSDFQKLVILK